jgi:hypothetical protein
LPTTDKAILMQLPFAKNEKKKENEGLQTPLGLSTGYGPLWPTWLARLTGPTRSGSLVHPVAFSELAWVLDTLLFLKSLLFLVLVLFSKSFLILFAIAFFTVLEAPLVRVAVLCLGFVLPVRLELHPVLVFHFVSVDVGVPVLLCLIHAIVGCVLGSSHCACRDGGSHNSQHGKRRHKGQYFRLHLFTSLVGGSFLLTTVDF